MIALKFPVIALACAAFTLSACNDPAQLASNTDPHQNRNSGAIAGGILGAGIGAITGNGAKGAALGAVTGVIAGAAIGSSLDRQAAELRAELARDGITITNTGSALVVSRRSDITFATNSFAVNESLKPDLAAVARHLLRYPNSTVQVIGHTDSDGDATFNLGLSQRRANAVAEVLRENGVPFNRLVTIGRGEEQPVASNLTPDGRAQNRRVEIIVIPNS